MNYLGIFKILPSRNKYMVRFLVGFIIGILLALRFDTTAKITTPVSPTPSQVTVKNIPKPRETQFNFTGDFGVSDSVSAQLVNQSRVLCWVLTQSAHVNTRVPGIKNTWGKRCSQVLFFSTENNAPSNESLINLKNVTENEHSLWEKTKEAFKFIALHHLDDADWFLKADDISFVILENLRYFLAKHNPRDSLYVEGHFKNLTEINASQGFIESLAGYVLSKQAFARVAKELNSLPLDSNGTDHFEETQFGKLLESMDITTVDSRDKFGKHRVIPLKPNDQLSPDFSHWYWDRMGLRPQVGVESGSHSTISYHVNSEQDMFTYEYLTYHLKPFGISYLFSEPE